MPKRKYTRGKEEAQGYECCNKKCKWQGTMDDQARVKVSSFQIDHVCPDCGKDEFYGLLEFKKIESCQN